MKSKKTIFLLLFISSLTHAQLNFNNLDSLLRYAEKNSSSIKINSQQSILAKWTKIAAIGNSINFRSPVSFSSTDNILLPVNFIPAEIFGGPAGSLKQVTFGQRYVSNFNFNPQLDIINPYAWAKVKSASVNRELTEVNNLITKKNLFESIAAAYYNCISLQEQITIMQKSLAASDSILYIVQNKFTEGIIREQDLNNAKVNQLNVNDKVAQLKIMLEQQQNSLKILCDIPSSTQITLSESATLSTTSKNKAGSNLNFRYSELQGTLARSELRAHRFAMFPVLSLVYYQGWQQNSNTSFYDKNSTWIQSNYIGFRISVPFPPDVNKMSQSYTSKVNYRIAKLNSNHTQLQNEFNNEYLNLDLEKASSTFETAKRIVELKKVNFEKSINQFKEGILPTDNLLIAFTDMLNSQLNFISSYSALQYSQSKITINNSVK